VAFVEVTFFDDAGIFNVTLGAESGVDDDDFLARVLGAIVERENTEKWDLERKRKRGVKSD
jgi:hypothetical protein